MIEIRKLLATSAIALFVAAIAGTASAQDCPRGTLDERFCDVDGDLIADVPTDASKLVDPDTLIFT